MFIFPTIVTIATMVVQSILVIVLVVLIAVAPLAAVVISSVPNALRLKMMNVLRQMLRSAPFRNTIVPERRERRIVHVQCRHARSQR